MGTQATSGSVAYVRDSRPATACPSRITHRIGGASKEKVWALSENSLILLSWTDVIIGQFDEKSSSCFDIGLWMSNRA